MGLDLDKGSPKDSENASNTFFTITIGMEFSGFATELTGLSFFVFYGHHNFETSAGLNFFTSPLRTILTPPYRPRSI